MKIAIVASIWISIPPKDLGFGAQETIAYYLARELGKRGHEVTVFATGKSNELKIVPIWDKPIEEVEFKDLNIKDTFELLNLSNAYSNAQNFDLIHNHLLPYGLLFAAGKTKTPTVHTLHHRIYKDRADFFIYDKYKEQSFVSISNSQREILPELNYISTVYNGVDSDYYSFQAAPSGDYLLYIGRMKKYKGIHIAIDIAIKKGLKLKIAAPLPHPEQPDFAEVNAYWEDEIHPRLKNKNIEYLGDVRGKEKVTLLQNAKALIFPTAREEPFGMTIVEAMSTGTPTIAFEDAGAVPEIIIDGESGFIVNLATNEGSNFIVKQVGEEGLIEAIDKLFNMPQASYLKMRQEARRRIEENFTIKIMVDNYEKTYAMLLNK